jgi:hypothetical protein
VDDDEAGAIGVASDEDEAGAIGAASEDDEAGAAASDDDEAGAIGAASDEDEAGAADEDDDTTAELEAGATGAVVLPRLKIQIRPMITITATMMIIQVLRFMGMTLGWRRKDWEE